MQEKKIIQKNLFIINSDPDLKNSPDEITENLTNEELKKESQKRPRERKNSNESNDKPNKLLNSEKNNDYINEESYSYKTIEKQKKQSFFECNAKSA